MKTKFKDSNIHLFLEKRLSYEQSPESPENRDYVQEKKKWEGETLKEIEEAAKALERGKEEHAKLVGDLVHLL